MEARIVQLPSVQASPSVRVESDRIVLERLVVVDPSLAAGLAERPEDERPAVVERALRIGLLAIQDAAVAVDVDVVRREFEKLLRQAEATNDRAAQALTDVLRTNFADGDGRLPRTLEKFLGDRGQLQRFVGDLFDETKRDSAIGRMSGLMGQYFDGDRSKLAQLLDPTRMGSPLHQFRVEISDGFKGVHERLAALEAASKARAEERSRSAAKGGDFEDTLEDLLGAIARGSGDLLDRTSGEAGAVLGSKKGDFVLTLESGVSRGTDLRIVLEAKDRGMSQRAMRDELREARLNRCAAVAVVIWSAAHAPSGVAPFTVLGDDVHVVVDPAAPEPAFLEAAIRLARVLAVASLVEHDNEIDAAAITRALTGVRQELEVIRAMLAQLTSVAKVTTEVRAGLEALRANVLARVAEAEQELRPAG
ncbi:MAG: hypothetical protein ACJ77N_10815 [Chloroflexota bacterium]